MTQSTLLDYAIDPNPNPLQASPQDGDLNKASLQFVISNGTNKQIKVRRISFTLPVGTNPKDLTNDAASIHIEAPDGWTVNPVGRCFNLSPSTSNGILGQDSVSFSLTNIIVNVKPGTFNIDIEEETGADTSATSSIPIAKFPDKFEVSELDATPPIINVGETTTLAWSGSDNATYLIEYGQHKQTVPHTGTLPISGLQETTTFFLVVTSGEGETAVTIQRHITVIVNRVQILSFTASPITVYENGLTKLSWVTQNADSCHIAAPVNKSLPANGELFVILKCAEQFTLTALGTGSKDQRQLTINVSSADPSHNTSPLNRPISKIGPQGPQGPQGATGHSGVPGTPPGKGGRGGPGAPGVKPSPIVIAVDEQPPIAPTFNEATPIFSIKLIGGKGGQGGQGGEGGIGIAIGGPGAPVGPGGDGGDGGPGGDSNDITLHVKEFAGTPMQYIIDTTGGQGGQGGQGSTSAGNGGNGGDGGNGGSFAIFVDGQAIPVYIQDNAGPGGVAGEKGDFPTSSSHDGQPGQPGQTRH